MEHVDQQKNPHINVKLGGPMKTNVTASKEPISIFLQREKYVGRKKLYAMIKAGAVPHYRLGRKILIDAGEVFEALRRGQD